MGSLPGGGGGGATRGTSTDRREASGEALLGGTGGGAARGAIAVGTGGGPLGGASVVGDTKPTSSTLESRACAFKASLCGTEEAMSVS